MPIGGEMAKRKRWKRVALGFFVIDFGSAFFHELGRHERRLSPYLAKM